MIYESRTLYEPMETLLRELNYVILKIVRSQQRVVPL